jgi:glycosyltransferase involved in cell wall biosynthesis
MKLIIQIPCYNEEETLPDVIVDLPRRLPQVDEIEYLVIDDGSTDRTVEVARGLGVHHILSLGSNQGLATAFARGVSRALELGADIIVNTDGDNQYKAEYIKDLIAPIVEGKLDIVIGTRPIEEIAHFSWIKKKLQQLGSFAVRQFSGTDVPDTTSGFRAYSVEAATKLVVFNRYTYTLETIIQAGHMNMRIGYVPIQVNPMTRQSRLISSVPKYLLRSVSIILRSYVTYKPLRIFFYASLVPITVGFLICLRFLYYFLTEQRSGHIQSLILAAVLILIGFHLIAMGILADLSSSNGKLIHEILYLVRKKSKS